MNFLKKKHKNIGSFYHLNSKFFHFFNINYASIIKVSFCKSLEIGFYDAWKIIARNQTSIQSKV